MGSEDTRFSRRNLLVGGGAACVVGAAGAPAVIRRLQTDNEIRIVETAVRYDVPPQVSGFDSPTDYVSNEVDVPISVTAVDNLPLYFVEDRGDTLRIHVSTDERTASTLLSADTAVRSPENTLVTPDGTDRVIVGGQRLSWLPLQASESGLRVIRTITSVEEQRYPQIAVEFDSPLSVLVSTDDTHPSEDPDRTITDPEPGERVDIPLDPIPVTVGSEQSRQDGEQQTATIEFQPTVVIRDLGIKTVVDGR